MDAKEQITWLRSEWPVIMQKYIGTEAVAMLREVADTIERLEREAELGRAAEKAIFTDPQFGCDGSYDIGCESLVSKCDWIEFCRLRAEREGAE